MVKLHAVPIKLVELSIKPTKDTLIHSLEGYSVRYSVESILFFPTTSASKLEKLVEEEQVDFTEKPQVAHLELV